MRIACKNEVGIILRFVGIPLRIGGTRSPEYSPNIEIVFKDIFLASTVFNWKTDTSHDEFFKKYKGC